MRSFKKSYNNFFLCVGVALKGKIAMLCSHEGNVVIMNEKEFSRLQSIEVDYKNLIAKKGEQDGRRKCKN